MNNKEMERLLMKTLQQTTGQFFTSYIIVDILYVCIHLSHEWSVMMAKNSLVQW